MLYHLLLEDGVIVPTTERTSNRTVVFHRDAIADGERLLAEALAEGVGRTVSELNAVLGTTRKFSIPLLEHWDSLGVTTRSGDLRYWNEGR
jgi:selenocysteine-specific elongation factor